MTKSDDKRVPALRFKGFTDEWEQRKLGEICKVTKLAGFEFTKYVNYSNTGSILAIRGINVKKGKFNLQDVKYIDNSNFSRLSRSKLQEGDILFTYVGTIGNFAIVPKNVNWYLAPNVCLIRPQDKNSSFISYLIQSDRFQHEEILKWITTSSQPALSMENIRKFKIILPLNSEQQKISSLVSKIDKLITLQQRKLKNYLLIKKKLSNIFFNDRIVNKNDLLFEHRVKANQLFISYSKKGFSHLPVLSATQDKGMVFRKDESKNILYTHDNLTNYKLVEPDDFVVHLRSFQGGFAYSDKTGIASPAYTIFKFKDDVDYNSVYWREKFKSYNFIQLLKKVTYGVRDGRSISFSDFLSLYLTFPDIEIQNKIGNALSKLDTRISDQKKIIKKLENIKQFLLQNMFI